MISRQGLNCVYALPDVLVCNFLSLNPLIILHCQLQVLFVPYLLMLIHQHLCLLSTVTNFPPFTATHTQPK